MPLIGLPHNAAWAFSSLSHSPLRHTWSFLTEPISLPCGASGSGVGEAPVRQEAILAPKVVDTTGAGDCFTAAYGVALLEDKAGAAALRFASAAGSICVRRKGAMPSLPSREEVDALLMETAV